MLRTFRRWCLIAALVLITWLAWPRPQPPTKLDAVHGPLPSSKGFDFTQTAQHVIAIIAPCDIGILLGMESAFSTANLTVAEITLHCAEEEIEAFTSFVNRAFGTSQTPIMIVQVPATFPLEFSLLVAASQSSYSRVLVLDNESVFHVNSMLWINEAVAQVEASQLPAGPCGWKFSPGGDVISKPVTFDRSRVFLKPPFIVDPRQVYEAIDGLPSNNSVWSAFGAKSAKISTSPVGGSVVSSVSFRCPTDPGQVETITTAESSKEPQTFVSFLSALEQLVDFQDTYCRLASLGHTVTAILFTEPEGTDLDGWFRGDSCYIRYNVWEDFTKQGLLPPIVDLGSQTGSSPTVLLVSSDLLALSGSLHDLLQTFLYPLSTLVLMTQLDFKHSLWMTALTRHQWENWNRVTVDLSVITNNRPLSLARLLHSLNNALHFGHSNIHLTVYMEQTADVETKKVIQGFEWQHGRLSVRHRVVKGGLIPAIVESWYPTSNDTYGLILEDDIEVSPLYFAWVQMAILRYRYDEPTPSGLQVYGMSLYQPKNVELRPEGRRPWSAQQVFTEAGLPFPGTPYLSATPCSWGAVYFPEHWREFHDYLISRMSEQYIPENHIIVPDVRSNRWQRSWKRFFIEFAYLRGYVMLYPNYDDFVSFSTNHVELGSHVSPAKVKVKGQFIVPLMSLGESAALLLQLPAGELPALDGMPVVDLHGRMSSLEGLKAQGESKRVELCGCEATPGQFNASELLCSS